MMDEKEPSKVLSEAESEAPKKIEQVSEQAIEPVQDALLTQEEFVAQMKLLTGRARAAGLNPIHTMARTYIKQGMAIVEGILASLESETLPKKKGK